jgi:RHS repeat-associated protein
MPRSSAKSRLFLVLATILALVAASQPAFAAPAAQPTKPPRTGVPKFRPTGSGTPPAGYPAMAKPPTHRSAVKTTPATVTDPQGDSLSVTNAVVGSFNQFNYQAYVGTYNGYYYEDCLDPTPAFGAVTLPFCASVQLTDAQTGAQTTTNNSQSDAVYDACGTLVGQYTTYGWRLGNNNYLSSGYIGSWPYTLPTSGVCWGTWSLVFSFTETFNDGQTLSETASSTFPAQLSLAETIAAQYPQGSPTGGPVDPSEQYGGCSDGHSVHGSATGYPVDTASGDFWHSFTDLTVPGRGPALNLSRTYNSATASTDSRFGYGWIDSYALSLVVNGNTAVARCEGGATMTFTNNGSNWTAPPRVLASLTHNGDGSWTLVRHAQKTYRFDATGRLTALTDLNGYTTTLSYPSGTQTVVTDPAGRTLTFTLTGSHVTSVADSASPPRTLSYSYDVAGNLTDVIDTAGGHWQFSYDAAHRMLTMRSPRFYGDTTTSPSPVVTNHYDSSGRVDWQTDQLGRQTSFDYTSVPGSTLITDPNGNVRLDEYTYGLLTATLRGYGSSSMSSTYYRYDPDTLGQIKVINGDGKITSTSYDANGNPTASTDPLGRTTSYTYNSLNQVTSVTEPKQVNGVAVRNTTSYDAAGNLLTHSAPLLDATGAVTGTATTTYHHDDPAHPGDVTSITDPNGHTTVDGYDSFGDLTSVTDPVGDKTSFGYDTGRGLRTSMVAPKGNATGGNPAANTTSYAYDGAGRLTTVKDPLWNSANPTQHQNVRHYDADGNLTSVTDGDSHTTSYSYDAAGEQTSVTQPNGSVQTTSYDGAGRKQFSYDGNNQQTYFSYDAAGRLVYTSDPLGRATQYGYDTAGQLITKTDPSGRITTNNYDAAGELTSISYSDGVTPNVNSIGYDADGQRISMSDGSGTSSWTYDTLHRLTSSTDGTSHTVGYGYDLGGRLTSIAYPNAAGTVTRGWDNANRLHTVADWSGHTTTFNYDANSNLVSEVYPNGTTATSNFDNANRLSGLSDAPTATPNSPFASFGYGLDGADQITSVTSTGVPSDNHSYGYDPANRLTTVDGSTSYGYDPADNPKTVPTGVSQTFDADNEVLYGTSAPAISYIGSTSAGDATTKVLTLALPTGTTTGDTVIAATTLDNNKGVTLPTGWTAVGTYTSGTANGAAKVLVYRHVVAAGETSVTLTYSNKFAKSVVLTTYRSAHPSAPIDVVASASTASGTSVTAAAITPTTYNERLLVITGADGVAGTWTAPAGMTMQAQKTGGTTDVGIADQQLTDLSAVGGQPASHSGAATQLVAVTIGLKATQSNYSYDTDGNRTSNAPLTGTAATLGYDQADRLTSYGATTSYRYNGDGQRVSRTVSSTVTPFVWDAASGSVPLLLAEGTNYYIYGPSGQPVEQLSGTTAQYYVQDGHGSTRVLTSSTGTVVASYTYDSYGNLKGQTGTVDTPLRWDGQYQDRESGLYYLRARFYDPATAQFVSVDPAVGMTRSPYGYVFDNPLNGYDPTGMFCWSASCLLTDAGIAVGAVAVAAAVVALAPEVVVGGAIVVGTEEVGALVVTAAGEEIATTATISTIETVGGISSTEAAATVGGYAQVAGYAVGAAKIVNSCADGLTAECENSISELIVSYGMNAVGAMLESPGYELANSVREFLNNFVPAGEQVC